jgi:hypothetical protein
MAQFKQAQWRNCIHNSEGLISRYKQPCATSFSSSRSISVDVSAFELSRAHFHCDTRLIDCDNDNTTSRTRLSYLTYPTTVVVQDTQNRARHCGRQQYGSPECSRQRDTKSRAQVEPLPRDVQTSTQLERILKPCRPDQVAPTRKIKLDAIADYASRFPTGRFAAQ